MTFRNVLFTINNYSEMVVYNKEKMVYLVYQEEIGEKGTPHLQGYMELFKLTRMNAVKTLLGGDAHLEARRGTQKDAIDYCKKERTRKEGTTFHEFGTAKAQGKRNDIVAMRDQVLAGKRERDIMMDDDLVPTLAKYQKLYHKFSNMNMPQRTHTLKVTLLIGETGLGKTKYVLQKYEGNDLFYKFPISNGTTWFDDYDRHLHVLLDDFAGAASKMTLTTLLQLLDYSASKVPVKGSHTWWMPNDIYVTTNIHPFKWYDYADRQSQYKALKRRFTKVILFTEKYEPQSQGEDFWIYTNQ